MRGFHEIAAAVQREDAVGRRRGAWVAGVQPPVPTAAFRFPPQLQHLRTQAELIETPPPGARFGDASVSRALSAVPGHDADPHRIERLAQRMPIDNLAPLPLSFTRAIPDVIDLTNDSDDDIVAIEATQKVVDLTGDDSDDDVYVELPSTATSPSRTASRAPRAPKRPRSPTPESWGKRHSGDDAVVVVPIAGQDSFDDVAAVAEDSADDATVG